MAIGLAMATYGWWGEQKLLARKRLVSIELQGLDAFSATPLSEASAPGFRGQKEPLVVDVREMVRGGTDAQLRMAIERIRLVKHELDTKLASIAREDMSRHGLRPPQSFSANCLPIFPSRGWLHLGG